MIKNLNMNNKIVRERLEKLVKQFEVLVNNYDFCLGEQATHEERESVKDQLKAIDYNIDRLVDLTGKNIFDILDHKLNINIKKSINMTKLITISEWVDFIEDETTRKVLETLDDLNYYKCKYGYEVLNKQLLKLIKANGNKNIIKRAENVLIAFRNEYFFENDIILTFEALEKVEIEKDFLELLESTEMTAEGLDFLTDLIHTTEYNTAEYKATKEKIKLLESMLNKDKENRVKENLEKLKRYNDLECFNILLIYLKHNLDILPFETIKEAYYTIISKKMFFKKEDLKNYEVVEKMKKIIWNN